MTKQAREHMRLTQILIGSGMTRKGTRMSQTTRATQES